MNSFLDKIKNFFIKFLKLEKSDLEQQLEAKTEEILANDDDKNIAIHSLKLTNIAQRRIFGGITIGYFCITLFLVVTLCIVWSDKKTVQPYLWGFNQNGQIFNVTENLKTVSNEDIRQKMPLFMLQEFVRNAFSVASTGAIQKERQNKSLSFVEGEAAVWLDNFYKEKDPFTIAKKHVTNIEINWVQQSNKINNFATVNWTATEREAKSGALISKQKYEGEFYYDWESHSSNDTVNQYNPIGFYINNINVVKDNSKEIFKEL